MRRAENRARVAILVVNGFDRRGRWGPFRRSDALDFPWIDLCLRQVERHSTRWDYEVFVFENTHSTEQRELIGQYRHIHIMPGRLLAGLGRIANRVPIWHVGRLFERPHPKALDYLASKVPTDVDYVVTLDSDSFPVREDWLDVLIGRCEDGAAICGVFRDEMAPTIRPFIHVSGLCMRKDDLSGLSVSFSRHIGQDIGQNITEEMRRLGRQIAPLRRSNKVNFHFLIGGLYGDVLYHHGAGSRKAGFWTSVDAATDLEVSMVLRAAAFQSVDNLVSILRGQSVSDLGIEQLSTDVCSDP